MMSKIVQNYAEIVELLAAKTSSGSITWRETSLEGVYATVLRPYTIHISAVEGDGPAQDIAITIHDSDGDIVDTFTDTDFVGTKTLSDEYFYPFMQALLHSARRNATGADKVVADIIDMLRQA